MREFPEVFKKYTIQLWYIFITPILFFIIMTVYRPFENPAALNMGRSLFYVNIAIMTSIIFVFLLLSRTLYYILRKFLCRNWWQLLGWSIMEFTVLTFFIALYLTLMDDGVPYFIYVALSLQYTYLILCVPYASITAIVTIVSYSTLPSREMDSVRFTDKSGNVKIVLMKDAILYIKADENNIIIHYKDGENIKKYTLRSSMRAIAPLVEGFGFFRCHRSYYVNPSHIVALRRDPNDIYSAEMDVQYLTIPVSRKVYPILAKRL